MPPGAEGPNTNFPDHKNRGDACKQSGGSTLECQNQILREEVGITGTPFSLHDSTAQVPGRVASNTLVIPLSGASVPAPLDRIDLEVLVAGQRFTQSFPPLPNQSMTFTWDGQDAYGRPLQGDQPITVRIGYHYPAAYLGTPGVLEATFAVLAAGIPISGTDGVPQEGVTLWQEHHDTVTRWDARDRGLGGWTLSAHHLYDPIGQVLYLGDGSRRSAAELAQRVITSVNASVQTPAGVTSTPDGSLYIADTDNHRIRRVGPDGIITTVAGGGTLIMDDGVPATQAQLSSPFGIAVDRDGSLLLSDSRRHRVRRVGLDGAITTVAGGGCGVGGRH